MSGLSAEVEAIADAIQAYASAHVEGGDPLVTQALVVFEVVSVGEDGDIERQVSYTVPTDNFSLSGAIGLAESARHFLTRHVL